MKRRTFLGLSAIASGSLCLSGCSSLDAMFGGSKVPFKISLAQWSWHRRLRGQQQPKMDNLDFAANARKFGVEAVEYVNQFFMDKAEDTSYLAQMKKRAKDNGVESVLIMCDGEGNLGDPDSRNALNQSRTTTSGSKQPNISAAIRYASTPAQAAHTSSNSHWPPTDCSD